MKTFIILTPGFPKDEEDSSCLPAFQQFALSLQKRYPEVKLIFISFQYPYEAKEYLWRGINVISMGGKNHSYFYRLFTWLKVYRYLNRLKKENDLLGVLSLWLSECALVGSIFCKRNRLKHYTWLIGQDSKKDNRYVKLIDPSPERVIAMSDFLKQELFNNHGILPFMVAENGINESIFPPLNTGERTIDLLGVGSLIPLKNYSLFIEIVQELQKKKPNIRVVIVGTGEEEPALKEKAKTLGLEKNIQFVGLLPHNKVFDLMNDSKIFMHTSHFEGNSTVLMEALYSGCYVLSKQGLSESGTKNLDIAANRTDFIELALKCLEDRSRRVERVVFNTMDRSAKKIMDLFVS